MLRLKHNIFLDKPVKQTSAHNSLDLTTANLREFLVVNAHICILYRKLGKIAKLNTSNSRTKIKYYVKKSSYLEGK